MRSLINLRNTAILSLVAALSLSACGSDNKSADTKENQNAVRDAQVVVLKASSAGDLKAYCAASFSGNLYNQKKSLKGWAEECSRTQKNAIKAARKKQKSLALQIKAVPKATISFQDGKAVVALPGGAPYVFQRIDDKWLLDVDAAQQVDLAQQQKTAVRDLTRFYLMTIINGDPNGYCAVTAKPSDKKACVTKAKAWVKDKKGSWADAKKQAQAQVKAVDKVDIEITGKEAKVKLDPEVKLSTANGASWLIISNQD